MNPTRTNRIGHLTLFLALAGTAFPLTAQGVPDKFTPLRAALATKKKEALVEAEDAKFQAGEFDKFLKDPETSTEEKPELRRTLVREQSRQRSRQLHASQIEAAIQHLRSIPSNDETTLESLQAAYAGLAELGARGATAWEVTLRTRTDTLESLQTQYDEELNETEQALRDLNTRERAQELLLAAIDHGRPGATNDEFRVSLKLPNIKSAAALGFGLKPREDNPDAQAQATLIALVGYSQFFWDHHSGAREGLAEDQVPVDQTRNIFGVADGGVLTSTAIARNDSSVYYLSAAAQAAFNRRLTAIWGDDVVAKVSRWDQNRARSFHRACIGLSSSQEDTLVPNRHALKLLDEIDAMIGEKERAQDAIERIHHESRERLAAAKEFGDTADLSASYFNAQRLAKDEERTIKQFAAADKLLKQQLSQCADPDWTPNAKGIAASAQILARTSKRVQLVRQVKHELSILLEN